MKAMKNKTWAVWITLLLGPLGIHRLYLRQRFDIWAWLLLIPSLLGAYGVVRMRNFGVNDDGAWLLMPLLGGSMTACALTAIVYGLMPAQRWNQRFNPQANEDASAGESTAYTVLGLGVSLFLGATVLMACLALLVQRYAELAAS